MENCCAPGTTPVPVALAAPDDERRPLPFAPPARDAVAVTRRMVSIPAGEFRMGGTDPDAFAADGEGPVRVVRLSAYAIDATAVSNARFAAFVKATGYVTDAERYGWSYVFHGQVHPAATVLDGVVPGAPWWRPVAGATWRCPEGGGSDITARQRYPVVHVSWHDATAYAAWAGKRLPTEAQWERAARGGLDQARFPWGDEFAARGRHRCNTWQGDFPYADTAADGFAGTAPVDAYRPNAFGVFNAAGNVWEWCADRWSATWHAPDRLDTRVDPLGPPTGATRVIRGGSYLCHESYCNRYRVAARTHTPPESTTGHTGFRCAAPLPRS